MPLVFSVEQEDNLSYLSNCLQWVICFPLDEFLDNLFIEYSQSQSLKDQEEDTLKQFPILVINHYIYFCQHCTLFTIMCKINLLLFKKMQMCWSSLLEMINIHLWDFLRRWLSNSDMVVQRNVAVECRPTTSTCSLSIPLPDCYSFGCTSMLPYITQIVSYN